LPPDRSDLPLKALGRQESSSYKYNPNGFAYNLELSHTTQYTILFACFSQRSNIWPITKASLNTVLYDLFPKDDMPCLGCRSERGVSCGCFPRFLRRQRSPQVHVASGTGQVLSSLERSPQPSQSRSTGQQTVTAASESDSLQQETATSARGRSIDPHRTFVFCIETSFMITPRTPAQDRPNILSFVEHLAEQHNRQEPSPQFRINEVCGRRNQHRVNEWHLDNSRAHQLIVVTPHTASPRECF
jgi:hypothetical protein